MIDTGNTGKGNNTTRDDWETPNILFDKLNKQYYFGFDCCATEKNSKCILYSNNFTKAENITVTFWMNPPFSKAKEMFEHFFKITKKGVAIYRCDNIETKVWQEIILQKADWIFIPKGRITYQYNIELRQGKGSRFPSALIGIGLDPPKEIEGTTLYLKKVIQ